MRIARLQSRPIAHRPALLVVVLAMALIPCAPALADTGETIIQRCTHGESLSGFPPRAYSRALKELSADAEEYTDCASLIRQAQVAAASGRGGAGGGGAAGSPAAGPVAAVVTPSEQQAINGATGGAEPVKLGGALIRPGVVHANVASAFSTLPAPLLATLALMLVCLLAAAGATARKRVRARRSD